VQKSRHIRRLHPHARPNATNFRPRNVTPARWLIAALFILSTALPSLTYAYAAHGTQNAAVGQQFAYAAVAHLDTYNIMVSSGGSERRVAEVDVDGIGFSDVTARLSPSGSSVAFRVTGDRQGGSKLYVLDIASGQSTLASAAASTAESISTYLWSPVGTALAFVRTSPAPYPQFVDDRYGRVYIYRSGQASALGGSHGSDRLLGFSGDGRGVYVSRLEGNNALEHLVYLPLAGGEATTLIRSSLGLRYSQFAVWAKPGQPAKVAAIAEGDFSLALPRSPKATATETVTPTSTSTPEGTGNGSVAIMGFQEPEPTQAPTDTPIAEQSPTTDATPTFDPSNLVPVPSTTEVTQPPTPDPLTTVSAWETPEATPTQEEPTTTSTPTATASETPTPVPTGVISHAPIDGRLSRPNGLGIIVSDPAGTMPVLLRRDAEAFSYVEWAGDGKGLMLGGTRSGAAWGVDMAGSKYSIDANLRDMRAIHWVDGGTAILADNPASRLVTLNFRSGAVVSAKGVGIAARSGQPQMRLAVPYIHQVNDVSSGNGSWACGPTSVAMTLAYYGKLLPWGQYVAEIEADLNGTDPPPRSASRSLNGRDYAPYIYNGYSHNGRTYTTVSLDAGGSPMSGLYGTICPTGLASWQMIQSVLSSHGLGSTYVAVSFDGVVGALKRGHPVILGNELTAAGHILVVIGYTTDGSLLVHDPYGNRFEAGYGGNYGGGVLYPWKRATARRALEVIGVYPPPPPGPRPTRTPAADATPTPTITPLPGIIEATAIPFDTPTVDATPTGDETLITPTPEPTAGIEVIPPGEYPTPVIPPELPTIPPREGDVEPTPTPFLDPQGVFYTLPVLLSMLAFQIFRRLRK
jgi:hypothetical protein